jgi:polysaccharide pyruvyl transferase WcaK-like protein
VAKVTARVSVRGIDLKEMMSSALDQLSELSAETWTITEVDLYGSEDIASRDGMAQLWSAQMVAETNV